MISPGLLTPEAHAALQQLAAGPRAIKEKEQALRSAKLASAARAPALQRLKPQRDPGQVKLPKPPLTVAQQRAKFSKGR